MAIYGRKGGSVVMKEDEVVVSLRAEVKERQEELARLKAELNEKKFGGGENGKGESLGEKKSVFKMWEEGSLYQKEVNKTIVDVKGDVKGASENFKKVHEVAYKPKASVVTTSPATKKAPVEGDAGFKPPSWAFAEKVKVIQKEDAKTSIGNNVNIESLKTSVTSPVTDKTIKKEWTTDNASSKGSVSGLLNKFNSIEVTTPSPVKPTKPTPADVPKEPTVVDQPTSFLTKWPSGEPGPKLLQEYLRDLITELDSQIAKVKSELSTLPSAA